MCSGSNQPVTGKLCPTGRGFVVRYVRSLAVSLAESWKLGAVIFMCAQGGAVAMLGR